MAPGTEMVRNTPAPGTMIRTALTMTKLYQVPIPPVVSRFAVSSAPGDLEEGRAMCHIGHMRHVTIRKLHEETGRIVDAAQAGELIVVRRRGVAVAELRGLVGRNLKVRIPDFKRRYAKFPRVKTDSGRILEEDRR